VSLRSGRIVYTNDVPLYAAFDAGAVPLPGTLHADVPERLNRMLVAGELDLSPISAFTWAAHADELALMPELCIGARGDVWSVLCVSARPLAELGGVPIATTRESRSGRNLLRVLLERRYGIRANLVESDDPFEAAKRGEPALLIGDRAIDAQLTFTPAHVHDLGTEWHAWTGLDMVFAVWAVRRDVLARDRDAVALAAERFVAARAWGAAHPEAVIAAAERIHPRGAGFYAAYFETLNFAFDDRARRGLARFVAELGAIGAIARVPRIVPEELVCP